MTLQRARLIAPSIHLAVFVLMWIVYGCQRGALLDGPSRWPFAILFLGDFPTSAIAFGAMFTSETATPYAIAAWGILGTIQWYFIGQVFLPRRLFTD